MSTPMFTQMSLNFIPVESKQAYFARMITSLIILQQQMQTYSNAQQDVMRMLDKDLLTKFNETSEEIKVRGFYFNLVSN